MKIIHYISFIIMPVTLLNNSYSMHSDIKNSTQDILDSNIANRDTLVKFNDSNNRCGLASLNQCFSILNSGDNEFLKQFTNRYYNLFNCEKCKEKVFDPKYIFEILLNNVKLLDNISEKDKKFFEQDRDKFLNGREGSDVAERYQRLYSILDVTQYKLNNINAFCEIRQCKINNGGNINYINLIRDSFDIGMPITHDTLNIILNNNDITNIDFYKQIQSNCTLIFNNNNFKLSALIFLCVNQDGIPNRNMVSHFVSAKQLSNRKWRLIDSSYNNRNNIYNSFEELMSSHVIPKTPKTKLARRLMPKLLFFTKEIQNNAGNKNDEKIYNKIQNNTSKQNIVQKSKINNTEIKRVQTNIKPNTPIKQIRNNIRNNKQISTSNTNNNTNKTLVIGKNNRNNKQLIRTNTNTDINTTNNNRQLIRANTSNNLSSITNNNQLIVQNEINNIINRIEENKKLIIQISEENGYSKNESDNKAINEFLNNIYKNKLIFDKILKLNDFKMPNKKDKDNLDDIYNYFLKNKYGFLFEKAIEIISTIFNLQQTLNILLQEKLSNA